MAKVKQRQVAVSLRALIQRINRKLAPEFEQLKATRGQRAINDLGDYYILDFNRNCVIASFVDVEELAKKLGCLGAAEFVSQE